eukprot:1888789-Rhodomonas_salina.2
MLERRPPCGWQRGVGVSMKKSGSDNEADGFATFLSRMLLPCDDGGGGGDDDNDGDDNNDDDDAVTYNIHPCLRLNPPILRLQCHGSHLTSTSETPSLPPDINPKPLTPNPKLSALL